MSLSLLAARRRRLGAAAAAAAAATGLAITVATGAPAAPPPQTYGGTCDIAGTASGYDPPLSVKPAARTFRFTATGTCQGGITGQPATAMPVSVTIAGKTTVDGCAYGITRAAPGVLRGTGSAAAQAIRIPFTVDVLIDEKVTAGFVGDHGGAAVGTGAIGIDLPTFVGCATGTLQQLKFTMRFRIVDPMVIDTPAQLAAVKG